MTRSYPVLLFFLAAVWGASYLFIKVAVDEIEPAAMMALRLVIAALLLVAFLFVVLLAIRFQPSERVSAARFAGILLGLAGVTVLAGANPDGGWWAAAGTLAVVASSLCYASGSLLGQRRVAETPGPVLATASMIGGALVLIPFALLQLPQELPGWKALGSVVALAVLGTTLAQLVFFRMLRLHGSARTTLVTYLLPPTALLYGALLLDEPLTWAVLAGLGLILAGVAVGSGALRIQRPRPEPAPRRT